MTLFFLVYFVSYFLFGFGLHCFGSGQISVTFDDIQITANNPGLLLNRQQTHNAPNMEWIKKNNKYYHLFMIDPDAPSPQNPIKADWLHLLAINIESNPSNDDVVTPYNGPTPPFGRHRYCIFIFETDNVISIVTPNQRSNFDGTQFSGWIKSENDGILVGSTFFFVDAPGYHHSESL